MKQNWETKTIGDVCKSASSNVSQNKLANDEGIYPIFGASGLIKNVGFYHRDKPYLSIVKDGSGVGRVTKMEAFTSIIGTLQYLLPNEDIDLDYLNYTLMSVDFKKYVAGAAIPHIYFKDYKNEPFLWMPLKEQQRIVAILDEAFRAIDKTKANTEQNLKNARELFESELQRVFSEKGDGWEEKEFGEIISFLTDYHSNGSYKTLKEHVELKETEDYAWMVRSTDFENDFENDFRFIDEHGYNFLSKSKILGGEIIMSKIGNAGNVYLMPKINRPCSLAMNLFLIRLNEKKALPEFIYQYLKTRDGELQIKARLNGATTKTITKENVRNILIPFPPIKEQQTIVSNLDALREQTKKLEVVYEKKLQDLEELKKSVLSKAFSGEL